METNHEELLDEILAIEAIYPDNLERKVEDCSIVIIKVPQHEYIKIQISFPPEYPSTLPPRLLDVNIIPDKSDVFDANYLKQLFQEVLDSVFHPGIVCLFDFLTELDAVLYEGEGPGEDSTSKQQDLKELVPIDPFEGWFASDPITDRGSTFMAFATHITSEEDAFMKLDILKTDTKMRKVSHIMSAWRTKVKNENGQEIKYQDSDDDGEAAAGSRMLHLITIMDVWGVMVIVARWFGGAHIGPDRFRHINSTAREAVLRAGFKNSQ
ncbi:similar to Saccharomyces cerevisiae YCR059C YIH1 Protein that inhibits activation of Gcn2p [Maudiozyma saulgeensis]|uniref:Similar to Saccharomyces cerevisiae YCR059C YIH1 Protein that inhibits activation of Gcn2p n=1 Tax=Maudiozyma saulgeensis TaxID=1789683 RepID=A0A1X7QZD2_9SACH|nr:similar to Saccharomyces cerevisiae YCR059C YIH1 Protein that inhibits activation of Gcn2p [Kazachstania saulgeensis]